MNIYIMFRDNLDCANWLTVKRLFDLAISLILLVCLMPLLILIALIIYLNSGMPIIYKGTRVGYMGRRFKIFKFRTMVNNAESIGGGTTGENDVRIMPFGKQLRKYKLDELPQLINILKGEMSLVGPRPELEQYVERYNKSETKILQVRPGITDYSSIAYRNLSEIVGVNNPDEKYENEVLPYKNKLRLKYVYEISFKTDIRIIIKTLREVIVR